MMTIEAPTKKTFTMKVEYWDCGSPDHRHREEHVALKCIQKRQLPPRMSGEERKIRNEAIYQKSEEGYSIPAIAEMFDLSDTRIRHIIARVAAWRRRLG